MGKVQIVRENVNLDKLKATSVEKINQACSAFITSDHQSRIVLSSTGKAHVYGYDDVDQRNFTAKTVMMNVNRGEVEVQWKTKDAGFVVHTREEFLAIVEELYHITEDSIVKSAQLKLKIQAAKTAQEVMSISWGE